MSEVFLLAYICLAVLAIVGSWYHIWFLYEDSSGFEIWLLIAIVVWGYERLLRILRVTKHGVKRAYITRIDDDKYLRVDIPDVTCHGHCFVCFSTLSWRVWENHPISVINCSTGQLRTDTNSPSLSTSSRSDNESPFSLSVTATHPPSKETGDVTSNPHIITTRNGNTRPGISLFIRPQNGLTRLLSGKVGNETGILVLIEASYAHHEKSRFSPTADYPNVLCIVGGVGITGMLPALNNSLCMFARPIGTTKLYWGVKTRGLVDAVKCMISGEDSKEEMSGEGAGTKWGHIEAHVTIGSRMDIRRVLSDELEHAAGGTIVVSCGPLSMCDEVRYTCAALARHGAQVRYVEESFSWEPIMTGYRER
ncbi:hypothetical protein ACJ41O_000035 [Fusarium nematophilum]